MARAILAISLLFGPAAARATEQVETVDAAVLSGQVVSIGPKALVLHTAGKDKTLPRTRIVRVMLDRADQPDDKVAQGLLVTHRGGAIAVGGLHLEDGRFKFTNALLGRTQIALGDTAAVFLPGPGQTARDVRRRCERMKIVATSQDIIVASKDGKLLPVRGVLKGIARQGGSSETKLSFRWQETDRTISLASVRAIVLAKTPVGRVEVAGKLTGRDGTQVSFSSLTLTGRTCQVNTIVAGARTLSRKALASISFATVGVDDLSAFTPTSVTEHGFFDKTFPHRVNRSVSGGPLRLDGRRYSTGLGLHSFCELTYALEGKYARLVAVAGIDDAVRPVGNAGLSLFGDGKLLARPAKLTGKGPAIILRVSLKGVKTLKIRVDFGSDGLDVADHVNLTAVRLIKPGL